jgi:hypothetical protein
MRKVIKKPTQAKKRRPLLVVSESSGMQLTQRRTDPKHLDEVKQQATALGYDVIVLPPGVSAYVSVS